LQQLTREELAAVMAHELAHVRNRDTLIMTVTATLAGAISMLANFAFFFGGNRDNNNPMGMVGVLLAAITARSPRWWCRWPSAARANIPPTAPAPRSAATRSGSPRPSPRSPERPGAPR
jgi:hypothetical protein